MIYNNWDKPTHNKAHATCCLISKCNGFLHTHKHTDISLIPIWLHCKQCKIHSGHRQLMLAIKQNKNVMFASVVVFVEQNQKQKQNKNSLEFAAGSSFVCVYEPHKTHSTFFCVCLFANLVTFERVFSIGSHKLSLE